jgi:sugar phosphate isomerase/epimerase
MTMQTHPITLFTGQWADMPFEHLAGLAHGWGFDGLELACDGDHFNIEQALANPAYIPAKRAQLEHFHLTCDAINVSLVGQCTCDFLIDERHRRIIPERIWGDGQAEGVRRRAAEEVKNAARAAAAMGIKRVIGFTGSPIWHLFYSFPPNDWETIEMGFREVVERWNPILDVFDEVGVKFCLEVHPTEIAYDFYTTQKLLEMFGRRPAFGINFDPSHLVHQFVDPVQFLEAFGDRIYHVHVKESKRRLDGRSGILGSHLNFGDPRRGWEFVSAGHGDIHWDEVFRALNRIGYAGPLSVEWEDSGMDREYGVQDALAFVRKHNFPPSSRAFDAAFSKE